MSKQKHEHKSTKEHKHTRYELETKTSMQNKDSASASRATREHPRAVVGGCYFNPSRQIFVKLPRVLVGMFLWLKFFIDLLYSDLHPT